jgi:hypothetical protein
VQRGALWALASLEEKVPRSFESAEYWLVAFHLIETASHLREIAKNEKIEAVACDIYGFGQRVLVSESLTHYGHQFVAYSPGALVYRLLVRCQRFVDIDRLLFLLAFCFSPLGMTRVGLALSFPTSRLAFQRRRIAVAIAARAAG